MKQEHNKVWSGKGFAGWSVSYLLTEFFNWKAYAFIRPNSRDYNHYLSNFKKGEYPVWNQPNTKIENYYIIGVDNLKIADLLSQHQFGWGFSNDGIHTWITNYTNLKECHWDGPPSKIYNGRKQLPPLFETTNLLHFYDYDIFLVVFPPE